MNPSRAADWLHWRGPEQTGVSRETGLPERWSPDPDAKDNNLVWKAPYGCRSTPLVMNGRVYVINSAGSGLEEGERVMCFDAQTGKVLWEDKFNVFLTDIVSSRVGWTNLAADPQTETVFAHGTQGFLTCYSKDGKVLWQRSLTEEYGRVTGYGGRIVSPTVDGDLVIIGMANSSWGDQARGANRFVAFDKRTGTPVWWSEVPGQFKGTYYSNPVVAVINGQRLLITGGADGAVHAFKVRTGERVWSYTFGANVINASPVVDGTRVYISHGEESPDTSVQGRIICLDAGAIQDGQPRLVWKEDGIKAGYTSPVVHDGKLYVCSDSARLYCFDAATGKSLWRRPFAYGRLARGSPVWADGKIYLAEVNAKFHILKPEAKGCKELHEHFFPSKGGTAFVETNGTPAVADGRIYFATRDEIYCIGKKGHDAKPDPPPAPQEETGDGQPTHLQVVPADVVLYPGESVEFKVRAYDATGRFLKEVPAEEWSFFQPPPPPGSKTAPPKLRGEITGDGKLTVDKGPPQQGAVLARLGKLTNRARVRVAPRLPVRQDFEKVPTDRPPAGWVNTQGKFAVVEKDGHKVLKKFANDSRPPLSRANAYLGLPTWKDYTIEADVLGTQVRENLPDMGLLNCRYHLVLDGNKQQLRLLSWEALPRLDHSIKWKWQPNTWYRLKLTVTQDGAKALVRGKAWPRGEDEPAQWTIEFADPSPNRTGSPALYGYGTGILEGAPGAEAYYDNVVVTPNRK